VDSQFILALYILAAAAYCSSYRVPVSDDAGEKNLWVLYNTYR